MTLSLVQMRDLADQAGRAENVAPALILAIAKAESNFTPNAVRGEPHLADASHGLMQILLSTARSVGFTGTIAQLYDPLTNLRMGARFLRGLLNATGGDVERAISAYNAGLGNARRATSPTRFCEIWKPDAPRTGRTLDQHCARIRNVKVGEFGNQPYVTKVSGFLKSFGGSLTGSMQYVAPIVAGGGESEGPATGQPVGSSPSPSTSGSSTQFVVRTIPAVIAAAVAAIWFLMRGVKS